MVQNYRRLLTRPQGSFFLLGIRGVGKSTWVKQSFSDKPIIFDLLNEDLYSELLVNKNLFYDQLSSVKAGTWVVVDEVQRLPSLLNACHRLIEQRKVRFALLGSSARKLRRAGVNLLGGRALQLELFPLTPFEMGSDFSLRRYLRTGGIPLITTDSDPDLRLKAYVQTYLREEIQQEALVRNLEGFARFLPIAGLFHGQVLNVEGLARDAGVARTTVQGYLEILRDTLLAFSLPAFEGRLRVKEKRHPKLFWVDPGLARAVKRQTGEVSPDERGSLFEGCVIQLIRTYQSIHQNLYDEIYYWASGGANNAVEVDLIMQRGSKIIAIEVKSGNSFNASWTKGLDAVAELKGVSRRILVYAGERSFTIKGDIEVLAFNDFLDLLVKQRL